MPFFRFCDLPKEIRILVYEECFSSASRDTTFIELYGPNYSIHVGADIFYNDEPPPPLFQVSKLIRQECLPVFAQSIEEVVVTSVGLSGIPDMYLTYVSKVILTDKKVVSVKDYVVPGLNRLQIHLDCHQMDTVVSSSSQDELRKEVLRVANRGVQRFRVYPELERQRSEGKLPFRVLLDQAILLRYRSGNQGRYRLVRDNVDVDFEKQEVNVNWRPKRPHSYE